MSMSGLDIFESGVPSVCSRSNSEVGENVATTYLVGNELTEISLYGVGKRFRRPQKASLYRVSYPIKNCLVCSIIGGITFPRQPSRRSLGVSPETWHGSFYDGLVLTTRY